MDTHYTQTDLEQVKRAIIDLTTGQRVTSISKNGRTIQFAPAQLDQLRAMERSIRAELAAAEARRKRQNRSRTVLVRTSKGL